VDRPASSHTWMSCRDARGQARIQEELGPDIGGAFSVRGFHWERGKRARTAVVRPLPTCPPRLRFAPRAGPRPPRRPRASPGSRLATATSSGAPDATVARPRRSPSFNVIAAAGRIRAGQGGMIEPRTEWLLVASPTENQVAYEDFLGLPPGRPQVVTTDSDNAIGGAVATALPRQDAAPPEHASASGTLAARCAADCPVRARRTRPARGGARIESSRPTGCAPHPRPPPDRRRGHRRGRVPSALTSTWSRTITPIGASWLRCACASPRSTPARSADRATRPRSSGWRGHR
jgi:hypothetical protein